jgi:Fe-S-cluster containining protein
MPSFDYPKDVRFSCRRCGDCCRTWNVMLASGEAESLASLDRVEREDDLVDARTVVSTRHPDRGTRVERLARDAEGACVYLGSDDLCRIQRHFGADAKPLMCRLYPFGFSRLGEGWTVDCSFSCSSIAAGEGEGLEASLVDWQSLLEQAAETSERSHRFDRRRSLEGPLLLDLQEHLLAFLNDPSLPLIERVRCCLQFVRLATTGDPTTSSAKVLRDAIAKGLPTQIASIPCEGGMDPSQQAFFQQWLYLTLNPVPGNFDQLPPAERQRVEKDRVVAGNLFRDRKGQPRIENRELAISWQELDEIDAGPFLNHDCAPLGVYLRAKITGQRYLVAGNGELPFVEAVPSFLLAYPMALWTSRALAADRGCDQVHEQDVRAALRLLDRTLGTLSTAQLPKKVRKACTFLLTETDLVVSAVNHLLGRTEVTENLPPSVD